LSIVRGADNTNDESRMATAMKLQLRLLPLMM
jgi:hypothetical protein